MATDLLDKPTGRRSIAAPPPAFVKLFAAIGLVVVIIFATTITRWILSADFRPAPLGTDVVPGFTLTLIRGVEVFFAIMICCFLWFLLIKPWVRDGKPSWDGLLMMAMFTMWVQDPMCNYFNYTFMYNAYFLNMGSWSAYLPGWQSPRGGNLPEPLLLMGGVYLWVTVVNAVAFCWIIRKLQVWFPSFSILACLPFAFVMLMLIDLATDLPGPMFGLYAYAAAPRLGTLWAGAARQLPIYTVVVMSAHYMAIGLLRLYRNDRGESFAERGVGNLQVPQGTKTVIRLLALIGFCNLSYFCNYFMPYNWLALQSDTMPKYPSYLRVDICGQGTPYACPSREVPIPSKHSLAISPNDVRLSRDATVN